jgi:hypothetical protein
MDRGRNNVAHTIPSTKQNLKAAINQLPTRGPIGVSLLHAEVYDLGLYRRVGRAVWSVTRMTTR